MVPANLEISIPNTLLGQSAHPDHMSALLYILFSFRKPCVCVCVCVCLRARACLIINFLLSDRYKRGWVEGSIYIFTVCRNTSLF